LPHECNFIPTKRSNLAEELITWREQFVTMYQTQQSQYQPHSMPPLLSSSFMRSQTIPTTNLSQTSQLYGSRQTMPPFLNKQPHPTTNNNSSREERICQMIVDYVQRINYQIALPLTTSVPSYASSSSSFHPMHHCFPNQSQSSTATSASLAKVTSTVGKPGEGGNNGNGEWVKILPLLETNETTNDNNDMNYSSLNNVMIGKIVCILPFVLTDAYYQHLTSSTPSTTSSQSSYYNTGGGGLSHKLPILRDYAEGLVAYYQLQYGRMSLFPLAEAMQQCSPPSSATGTIPIPMNQIFQVLIMTTVPLPSAFYPFQYPPNHSNTTAGIVSANNHRYYYVYPAHRLIRMNAKLLPSSQEYQILTQSVQPGRYDSLQAMIDDVRRLQSYRNTIALRQGIIATPSLSSHQKGKEPEAMIQKVGISGHHQGSYVTGFVPSNLPTTTISAVPPAIISATPSPGYVFIVADYCQIELRILTHYLQDPTLLSAFQLSASTTQSYDIFKHLASHWKERAYDQITDTDRQEMKQLCYAILYGAGVHYIAKALQISKPQAKQFLTSFHDQFPRLAIFVKELQATVHSQGYVETLLGRKRRLCSPTAVSGTTNNNLQSSDKQQNKNNKKKQLKKAKPQNAIEQKVNRQILNTLCQGSAADLVKVSTSYRDIIDVIVDAADDCVDVANSWL